MNLFFTSLSLFIIFFCFKLTYFVSSPENLSNFIIFYLHWKFKFCLFCYTRKVKNIFFAKNVYCACCAPPTVVRLIGEFCWIDKFGSYFASNFGTHDPPLFDPAPLLADKAAAAAKSNRCISTSYFWTDERSYFVSWSKVVILGCYLGNKNNFLLYILLYTYKAMRIFTTNKILGIKSKVALLWN